MSRNSAASSCRRPLGRAGDVQASSANGSAVGCLRAKDILTLPRERSSKGNAGKYGTVILEVVSTTSGTIFSIWQFALPSTMRRSAEERV